VVTNTDAQGRFAFSAVLEKGKRFAIRSVLELPFRAETLRGTFQVAEGQVNQTTRASGRFTTRRAPRSSPNSGRTEGLAAR
jgi:hypothetical protein